MATSPSTQVRNRLKALINTCYTAEGWTAEDDKLDDSLGQDRTRIAVYPVRQQQNPNNAAILETECIVQFLGKYDPQINAEQKVNPATVEAFAERLQETILGQKQINDPHCWYFEVRRIEYHDDPTGNKTRYEMEVRAFGSNPTAL